MLAKNMSINLDGLKLMPDKARQGLQDFRDIGLEDFDYIGLQQLVLNYKQQSICVFVSQ